jgi:hypothetical protein
MRQFPELSAKISESNLLEEENSGDHTCADVKVAKERTEKRKSIAAS